MRPEDILDAIGDVDDACVKKAKDKPKPYKAMWIAVGSLAACLLLVFLLPLDSWLVSHDFGAPENEVQDNAAPGNESAAGEDIPSEKGDMAADVLEEGDVWIYYVNGDEICRVQELVSYAPAEVFAVWKEKNGIGEDVRLIKVQVDDNSQTTVTEFQGEGVVKHTFGDCFVYNLTISKEIERYYGTVDSELLLRSLEQTMTGCSSIEYDEYHLFLE